MCPKPYPLAYTSKSRRPSCWWWNLRRESWTTVQHRLPWWRPRAPGETALLGFAAVPASPWKIDWLKARIPTKPHYPIGWLSNHPPKVGCKEPEYPTNALLACWAQPPLAWVSTSLPWLPLLCVLFIKKNIPQYYYTYIYIYVHMEYIMCWCASNIFMCPLMTHVKALGVCTRTFHMPQAAFAAAFLKNHQPVLSHVVSYLQE